MDTGSFANRLGGIGLLDATQRARVFRGLTLAEASVPFVRSYDVRDGAIPCGEASRCAALWRHRPSMLNLGTGARYSLFSRERLKGKQAWPSVLSGWTVRAATVVFNPKSVALHVIDASARLCKDARDCGQFSCTAETICRNCIDAHPAEAIPNGQ